MTDKYIEFLMGHKIKGIADSYFDALGVQEEILMEYLDCQKYLTIFTEQEVLQKQYDNLVAKSGTIESVHEENQRLHEDIRIMLHEHEEDIQALLQEVENMKKSMIAFQKIVKEGSASKILLKAKK